MHVAALTALLQERFELRCTPDSPQHQNYKARFEALMNRISHPNDWTAELWGALQGIQREEFLGLINDILYICGIMPAKYLAGYDNAPETTERKWAKELEREDANFLRAFNTLRNLWTLAHGI